MSADDSPAPTPLVRLQCDGCGYGVSTRRTPARCPMCQESAWTMQGWRPFAELERDLTGSAIANQALTREIEASRTPGVPFS